VYTTKRYSTSFSSAIKLLHKDLRQPIYDIYGFVRFADEIVDTFHEYDKERLLKKFSDDTWDAIRDGISLNPILQSFQVAVNRYNIPHELIHAFLKSMEMDLGKKDYHTEAELDEYIYGSAEVVGLMCLCVFCEGDIKMYEQLKGSAQRLGAALQKVNFLRDLHADYTQLNRSYFPGVVINEFDEESKYRIEASIAEDFEAAREGIRQLPWKARYGVYTAYRYYNALFKKICRLEANKVLEKRISVPNLQKVCIVFAAGWYNKLNWI
jgi:phytoene/squalene synthetase